MTEVMNQVDAIAAAALRINGGESAERVMEWLWDQGYAAKRDEIDSRIRCARPSFDFEDRARAILRQCNDARVRRFAKADEWQWDEDVGFWSVKDDDISVKLLDAYSVLMMEPGGEFAGTIYHENGTIIRTGEGTFIAWGL